MQGFEQLWQIIGRLRNPETGCPWDLKQTSESLIPNFIEELYEVVEAIEKDDSKHLKEELGDLMLHILMQARIAEENNQFLLSEIFETINQKLISRHPHIFGENTVFGKAEIGAEEIKNNWEKIKHAEKKRESILDGIPLSMPALIYAQRMQDKAASVGFDWDNVKDVIKKVDEELLELKDALQEDSLVKVEEEIGDMFFSLVNLSRKMGLNPEKVLKRATAKFYERFRKIEEYHKENNENIFNSSLERLDELWEASKERL